MALILPDEEDNSSGVPQNVEPLSEDNDEQVGEGDYSVYGNTADQ